MTKLWELAIAVVMWAGILYYWILVNKQLKKVKNELEDSDDA